MADVADVAEVAVKKERKKRDVRKIIAVEIRGGGLFPVEGFRR